MLSKIVKIFTGDKSARVYKRNKPSIALVNEWDEKFGSLSDAELAEKTPELRSRFEAGETLDDLLPEAFAVVKQACRRLCGQTWEAGGNEILWEMVPFDVQIAGAIELHRGNIAEMATGEGKTLAAVMPLYLNALAGHGSHLVTVNDYLARRDSEWMGRVFEMIGMTVGCILTDMSPEERRKSYGCDVTYGTNNEFGFDYLRDNMAMRPENLVQRVHFYAIVDEVDSVLIDEARTPLIISGAVDRSIAQFSELKPLVSELVRVQGQLISRFMSEAEELIKEDDGEGKRPDEPRYQAGVRLLQARKGYPKHPKLMKIMGDASMQRLVDRVENDYMRDKAIGQLEEELYFAVDERGNSIDLTQKGREALSPEEPELYLVPDIVEAMAEIEARDGSMSREEKERLKEHVMAESDRKTETIHCLSQLLRAYTLFSKDDEYVVQENKVIIVDEFTGRLMSGRRWSDGLHQAVEAKEGVKVEKETQTLATITLQNYFRMYDKLAGMTGTADTEASEFGHTYRMGVSVVPTNRPIHRLDDNDLIYRSEREKYGAIVERIREIQESGMPVLIGTTSVEVSEKLSRMLQRAKISHNVLNAKHHEREAQIVREAGQINTVTIATNMAGRGTDIKLGDGVVRCRGKNFEGTYCAICPYRDGGAGSVDEDMIPCGLQVIGTERHEARRIDNQLRGRSGRQGDPGYSQFYVSLEDDLMRKFASDRMASLMGKGFEEGEAMAHGLATRAIGSAQKKIEDINFEQRKRTLEYDNVMNKQRAAIYSFRRRFLIGEGSLEDEVLDLTGEAIDGAWQEFKAEYEDPAEIDVGLFLGWIARTVPMIDLTGVQSEGLIVDDVEWLTEILERIAGAYVKKEEIFGAENLGRLSRVVALSVIDGNWRDHLLAVDVLREGIYLRSYGQLNPLTEYQREASELFEEMMYTIHKVAFDHLYRATIVEDQQTKSTGKISYRKDEAQSALAGDGAEQRSPEGGTSNGQQPRKPTTVRRTEAKIGRNDPCPCGSGKKYKKCHGSPAKSRG